MTFYQLSVLLLSQLQQRLIQFLFLNKINCKNIVRKVYGTNRQLTATDDITVATDAPTLSEVESAIKKLKLGRAPGGDCIICRAPEMLKLLAPTSAAAASALCLHIKLFGQVCISGHIMFPLSERKEL